MRIECLDVLNRARLPVVRLLTRFLHHENLQEKARINFIGDISWFEIEEEAENAQILRRYDTRDSSDILRLRKNGMGGVDVIRTPLYPKGPSSMGPTTQLPDF